MAATKSTVLILGAGMVAKPLVHYLSNNCHYKVILGSRTLEKAQQLCLGATHASAIKIDIEDESDLKSLEDIVKNVDAVISMLPFVFHAKLCKISVRHKKHFLTTSYVSDEMRALDVLAKEAGVIIVNECGVDPGTDIMSAQRMMDKIHADGGKIVGFKTFCGGLPAPEDSNNPLGFKFSWSPRGVLLSSRNPALYLKDGKEVHIPGPVLFENYEIDNVEGIGPLEVFPNRNSVHYLDVYNIRGECQSIIRGTYRYLGWCEIVKKLADLGYLDVTEEDFSSFTYAKLLSSVVKSQTGGDLKANVAAHLGLDTNHRVITTMDWLGLFSDEPIPPKIKTRLDALCAVMLARMAYAPGERDMLLLQHTFNCVYPKEGKRRTFTSTLMDFGIKNGDSSMSRTVSYPVAIATKLVLEGKLKHLTGLVIPTLPDLYNPILDELATLNIKYHEKLVKEENL